MKPVVKPKGAEEIRELLRQAPPQVRYDVDLGYARHRRLTEQGTPLPDWAAELPDATPGGRARWFVLAGGALIVAGGVWLGWPAATPSLRSPTTAAPASGVASLQPPAAAPNASRSHTAPGERAEGLAERRGSGAEPGPLDPSSPGVADVSRTGLGAVEAAPLASAPIAQDDRAGDTQRALEPATTARAKRAAAPAARASESPTRIKPVARVQDGQAPTASERAAGTKPNAEAPRDREEVEQLARAEQLLAADPLRALRLAREGNARFRGGYLRQERHYVEVTALFSLGRIGEAHAHAQWFLGEFPSGPYSQKIEAAMARYPLR